MNPENPIRLPGNPIWNVFKRFGRDEFIALAINLIGTLIMSFFTQSLLLLSVTGPVIEKIGFFPAYLWEAIGTYRTTPKNQRKSRWHYFKKAMRGGSVSLAEDICVHDPAYILLFMMLASSPGIPVWVIVFTSFLVAVGIVAVLEFLVVEARYWLMKRRLVNAGFKIESYFESRFIINNSTDTEKIKAEFLTEFPQLNSVAELTYHDDYFETSLPHYSGRIPVLRIRHRDLSGHEESWAADYPMMRESRILQTAQVVYTRSIESPTEELEQFRFFPAWKDKIYLVLEQDLPENISEIENGKVRLLLKGRTGEKVKEVSFRRILLLSKENDLLVAIDTPEGDSGLHIIEIKTFRNIELFMTAMRFAMKELPTTQTTLSKFSLDV